VPRRAASIRSNDDGDFVVTLDNEREISAGSVVVATGVQYRKLPLARLEDFEGAGVYYAATETEARFCTNSDVVVIGGGNSAGQAAMYLCRTAKHVHVLVRSKSLAASMSSYLTNRLEAEPRITVHYETQLTVLHGGDQLEQATVKNSATGETWTIDTNGVFIMVGAAPNTKWLKDCVELDDKGFIKTGPEVGSASPYGTSREGIFAVGDVRSGSVKRVASAVGEGSVTISAAWGYVNRPK
ncbi:MAG: NAD(P)/FAD-dependent oxidoreductase, partial [Pseudomonadota bacterium]